MLDYNNPHLVVESAKLEAGRVQWRSPSNLAIIKYWGKHGRQLPRNPSISLTLKEAYTETTVGYEANDNGNEVSLEFFFNNQPQPAFEAKLLSFLSSILDIFPFLKQLHLSIHSSNSFPHSAGIASSASSMSALALCLCSIERALFGGLEEEADFWQKASYVARLGSGSASRSVYPLWAAWGQSDDLEGTSDEFAIPCGDWVHEEFNQMQDAILLVHKGEKAVSSRAGHALMENNPFAAVRYDQANMRFRQLMEALRVGDWEVFGRIAEDEALSLHALMMTSSPSYLLMQANSLQIIHQVRDFRAQTNIPLYFSLDAGPNVHLLYPNKDKAQVNAFIEEELTAFCVEGSWIADSIGQGPEELPH